MDENLLPVAQLQCHVTLLIYEEKTLVLRCACPIPQGQSLGDVLVGIKPLKVRRKCLR